MNPVSAVVVFIVIWWLVLFMVLPFGVRRTESPEMGHDPGARGEADAVAQGGGDHIDLFRPIRNCLWHSRIRARRAERPDDRALTSQSTAESSYTEGQENRKNMLRRGHGGLVRV